MEPARHTAHNNINTYGNVKKHKTKNVNKNNVEYILRVHLVKVTWPLHNHPGDSIMYII